MKTFLGDHTEIMKEAFPLQSYSAEFLIFKERLKILELSASCLAHH
jgi:hypothetical protein